MSRLSHIALIFAVNVMMCVLAEEIKLYSDRYDYVDMQAILINDTVRDSYHYCFMELAPCTSPEQKSIIGKFVLLLNYFHFLL